MKDQIKTLIEKEENLVKHYDKTAVSYYNKKQLGKFNYFAGLRNATQEIVDELKKIINTQDEDEA